MWLKDYLAHVLSECKRSGITKITLDLGIDIHPEATRVWVNDKSTNRIRFTIQNKQIKKAGA